MVFTFQHLAKNRLHEACSNATSMVVLEQTVPFMEGIMNPACYSVSTRQSLPSGLLLMPPPI